MRAEGCLAADRPGSTCALNLLPLFQNSTPLLPSYTPGGFPAAEAVHAATIKLPVWHREEDMPLVDSYIEAFRRVTHHHYHDLKG